jgi:lysozyme
MSLKAALTRDEGFEEKPYLDTENIWTFAIGRNLEHSPLTGAEWKALLDAGSIEVKVTRKGAEYLLGNGIAQAEMTCATTFKWWPNLDPVRRDVIANLCFNMGIRRLLGFRNMLAAMSHGDFGIAADELMDSKYATQVGQRAQRLAAALRSGVAA